MSEQKPKTEETKSVVFGSVKRHGTVVHANGSLTGDAVAIVGKVYKGAFTKENVPDALPPHGDPSLRASLFTKSGSICQWEFHPESGNALPMPASVAGELTETITSYTLVVWYQLHGQASILCEPEPVTT